MSVLAYVPAGQLLRQLDVEGSKYSPELQLRQLVERAPEQVWQDLGKEVDEAAWKHCLHCFVEVLA